MSAAMTCPGATRAPKRRREVRNQPKHKDTRPRDRLGDVRARRPACSHPPAIAASEPVHSKAKCSETGKKMVTRFWDFVQGYPRPARVALEWVWLIAVSNPCSPTVAKGNSSCSSRAEGKTCGQCIGRAGCNQHAPSWPIQPGGTTQRRPQPRKPGTTEASDGGDTRHSASVLGAWKTVRYLHRVSRQKAKHRNTSHPQK